MNKLLKSIVLCIAGILLMAVSGYAMPDLQTMYGPHFITDDGFTQIMSYENSPIITGWDVDVSGGTITSSQEEEWFRIRDTSKIAPVSMSKKLRKTENCIVMLETSVKLANSAKNSYFRLSGEDGTKDVFRLSLSGGKFYVSTDSGKSEVQSFKLNTFYGIKLRIDLSAQKYDFWLDGQYVGNFAFPSDVTSIDFVEIKTGVQEKAEIYMNGLKIHTGFALNEQFFAHTDGRISEDWNVHTGGDVRASTERIRSDNWPDYYSARLSDTSSVEYASIEHDFENLDKQAGFEVKICAEKDNQEFSLNWKKDEKCVFNIESKKNGFFLNGKKIYDYIKNVWYILSIEADFETKKANIYINNRILLENVSFNGDAVNCFEAVTSITKHSEFLIDDILAYEINEPQTYVPEPKKIESNDVMLGVQTCDMWREGHHLGWDYALADPDRIPYIGFFDDGSREAADWDIKYMVESGIDYRLTCWFTPRGYNYGAVPIKKGSNSYSLLEGVMRAKYSDKMKYTIMWENAAATNVDHNAFKNYIVPYWIEYFIKDPRYLVVDNKPVVYLYLADYFCKYQCGGDVELARECLDYLRDECRKLGYDGCTIIASRGTNSEVYAAQIGCDGIYSYAFSASEMISGAQPKNLKAAKENNSSIFVQPTVCQGFEGSAWLRTKGAYSSVDTFRENLYSVRDEFFKGYDNYNLSEKLVMLATWNEYCEGHYIAPCGLAGFDYLDAVREVFTDSEEYIPEIPTDEQKRNYCILFPENREAALRGEPTTVPVRETVVKKWEGEDLKKWTLGKQISNFSNNDGIIKGDCYEGVDPSVMSDENLGINADGITYVRVRINQISTKKSISLFFIREDDTKWNEAKGITITPENAQDGFYDVYFPVWQRGSWKGIINQIRIDPLNALGSFEIEKVEFLKGAPGDILNITLDGKEIQLVSEVTNVNRAADFIPSFVDGTFYMPPSCYNRYFGIKFNYVAAERVYKAATESKTIEISVDTGDVTVNGKAAGTIPVKLHKGLYLIPLRGAMEALGYTVEWDSATYTAILTSPTPEVIEENSEPAGIWNFNEDDNVQDWEAQSVSQMSAIGGVLRLTAATTDPQIYMRNISLDATKYKVLKLRIKNYTKSKLAELFFATDTDSSLNAAKSFKITIEPNTDDFVEYEIDLNNASWKGTITQLRFDPVTAIGDMEIDYIMLCEE